jgi:N utilization substance protein A
VATDRGISPDEVLAAIEYAILAAFKKEHPDIYEEIEEKGEEVTAVIDQKTGATKILAEDKDITPPGFGRIATQTAYQIVLQKIREVEKDTITSQYKSQVGSLIKGRIIKYDGYNAFIDIGKAEAVMPKDEQVRSESYSVNESLTFYLKEIREDRHGNSRIIVSRSNPAMVSQLFSREVPEIAAGTVEVKNVVREAGERSKISVYSAQSGVDPVGACVGQKGLRVQTVTDELGGREKIDIIQWNKDVKIYLTSALSPAKIDKVEIDEEEKKARVTVQESEAPLAIGKSGINVNLAARLTGYEIDIVQATEPESEDEEKKETLIASTEENTEQDTSEEEGEG